MDSERCLPLLAWLAVTLPGCGGLFGDAIPDRRALSSEFQTLGDRYDKYIDVENQRGNYRRSCELLNEFKAHVRELCRMAESLKIANTCAEDSGDHRPHDCASLQDAEPFTPPSNPFR